MFPARFPPGEASAPPLFLASAWTSAGLPEEGAYAYGRMANPTWEALEAELGRLETAQARVFASGQAASLALLLAFHRRRVLLAPDSYYGFRRLLALLGPYGFAPVPVDLTDPDAVAAELEAGDALLWVETPTNPFLRVFDVARLSELAEGAGAPLVVDNTTATAALQQPLDLGAVATLTSLTKGTSGHNDVVLGALATRDEHVLERASAWRQAGGGVAGPMEAWLALRGVRTLELRARRQSESALAIARWLAEQRRVRRVHYPGIGESAALARRQMPRGFGPLLAFEYDGDAAATDALILRSRCFRPATSFGGTESSWERRARWASESAPESLVRVSVGIEDPEALLADLEQALEG